MKPHFAVFILVLFLLNPLLAESPWPTDKEDFQAFYNEGKITFYNTIKENYQGYSFYPEDERKLQRAEKHFSGLYNHLMNFYYIMHSIEKDSDERSFIIKISAQMAREFLQSIPKNSARPDLTPLSCLLLSTGYYARSLFPRFRTFMRPMTKKVKNQDVIQNLNIRDVHRLTKGKGVRLAIIDTGVDPTVREIRGRMRNRKNLLDGSKIPWSEGRFPFDWEGHGTSIASVIYQIAPKVELMIAKFYDVDTMQNVPPSRWTHYLIAAGMIWAARNGADIINLSVSTPSNIPSLRKATRYCWENNIIVVASMGNEYEEKIDRLPIYPASYPWTIAVGGVEKADDDWKVWRYSSQGQYIDVVAPARNLRVEVPRYQGMRFRSGIRDGNSLAVSFVSGTAALILSAMDLNTREYLKSQPGMLPETVRDILQQTASNQKLGFSKPNPNSGYGLIEIRDAVLMAMDFMPQIAGLPRLALLKRKEQ